MKIEDLIKELEKIKEKYGNLEVHSSEIAPFVTTIKIGDEKDTINCTYKTVVLL